MEVMSSLVLELLEDPYLSIDPKTISGKISWWAMVLGVVLCVNGLLTFSMVVWFSPKCLSWMSFRVLTTFGYFAGGLLLAFISFKVVYASVLLVAKWLFTSVGLNLQHPQFESWRSFNAMLIVVGCITKLPLLGLPIHLPSLFVITCLVNWLAVVLASVGKKQPRLVADPPQGHTKGVGLNLVHVDNKERVLREKLLARCKRVSSSVPTSTPGEQDLKEQHLIQLVLYGLEKGVPIEAIKLLCTNPETQEIYQPSPTHKTSKSLERTRILNQDQSMVKHQAFSDVCEVLRGF